MGSPFFDGLTLGISDGNADLPQHLLIDLADRRSQCADGSRGVEVENRHKVLMGKIAFRLQSAAGHQGVGNADGGGCLKLYFDVKLIIFLQKGTVNDIEEVLLMLRPVFACQFSGPCLQLLGKVIAANLVSALQHGRHRIPVLFLQLPQPGGTGMFAGPGVRDVEHIAQTGFITGIVHQGDTLGATAHIAAHFFIP